MWQVKGDIAMSAIPKNGSTSIKGVIGASRILENSEVLAVPTRVAWVREPIDRLISAYSFFYYLNEQRKVQRSGQVEEFVSSWETFVDHVLNVSDAHWNPQVDMLTHKGIYVPTITHKFEDIHVLWGNYIPGLLPWKNGCSHLPTTEYRHDELLVHYEDDKNLWLSL